MGSVGLFTFIVFPARAPRCIAFLSQPRYFRIQLHTKQPWVRVDADEGGGERFQRLKNTGTDIDVIRAGIDFQS